MRWVAVVLVAVATSRVSIVRADDELDPDVIDQVKAATVYLRVGAGADVYQGSGFVIRTTGDTCYIGTTAGVVMDRSISSNSLVRAAKPQPSRRVKVVFRSGRKDEWSGDGTVTDFEPEQYLAIVRVDRIPRPPRPLTPETVFKFYETMPLFVFGFPHGDQLAVAQEHPVVSIGRSAVSGLNHDKAGRLLYVRIDGNLNRGNNGGPVVSAQGRVVGVATTTLFKESGIGICVPGADLKRLCPGRSSDYLVAEHGTGGGQMLASARVLDTLAIPAEKKIKAVDMYYVRVANTIEKPAKEPLGDDPAAILVPLTIEGAMASATFTVELGSLRSAAICTQFKVTTADGETIWSELVRATAKAGTTADGTSPSPASGVPGKPRLSDAVINPLLADLKSATRYKQSEAIARLKGEAPQRPRPDVARALEAIFNANPNSIQPDLVEALITWGDDKTDDLLLAALPRRTSLTQAAIIDALARRKVTKSIPALANLLGEPFVQAPAGQALKSFGAAAERPVAAVLLSKDILARMSACAVLAEIGTSFSLPALAKAGKDLSVKQHADAAYGKVLERVRTAADAGELAEGFQVAQYGEAGSAWMVATAPLRGGPPIAAGKMVESVSLYYVRAADAEAPPKLPLGDDPAATAVPLALDDPLALAAFAVDLAGELRATICAQFKMTLGDGEVAWSELVRATVVAAPTPVAAAKPPAPPAAPAPSAPKTAPSKPATAPKPAVADKPKHLNDLEIGKLLLAIRRGGSFDKKDAVGRFAIYGPARPRPDVARALEAVLAENDSFAQQDAARALGLWGDSKSVKPLMTALENKSAFVRREAANALARLGAVEAIPRLVAMLQDFFTQEEAQSALRAYGDRAEEAVAELLTHRDPKIRESACRILRDIGTSASLPQVEQAVQDKESMVQFAARSARDAIQKRQQEDKEAAK